MFHSATLKLTLWYLAIVMAISVMFSGVLYSVTTHELNRGLRNETQRFYRQIPDDFQLDPRFKPLRPDARPSEHRILVQLIALNTFVLIGAGFASYYLARRTLEPIEAAHEQQKRFTANVTHELRTPLTAIRMESEVALLDAKNTAPQLRGIITSNLEEVDKLEALINNLLRLANLEANEVQEQFAPVDTKTTASAAIEQVKKIAEAKSVTLGANLKSATVLGDRETLTQLLVILLDNAVKYSSAGSTITTTTAGKGDHVTLTVSDQGSGIDAETLPHIFDRFYRADSSRNKEQITGFGLGLSIAKTITELHHGTIELTSKPGKGTTATVTLPKA
jgi:signal transduction histidine kinase